MTTQNKIYTVLGIISIFYIIKRIRESKITSLRKEFNFVKKVPDKETNFNPEVVDEPK